MEQTQDPDVVIEERRQGYIRYRSLSTGRRWEVIGECVGLAHCIVGAIVDGKEIETLEEARKIWREYDFPLDSPITPEFTGCCEFEFRELDGD